MMSKIINYKVLFLGITILFIVLHVGGLNIPYHQDEYKWIYYSHPEISPPGTIPHPPLTEFVYTRLGPLVGDNNFRVIPFAFGLVNLFLIFYLAKIISDNKTALWTAFLFTISFYSLLASLMVDVDGAVMPMFLLIMAIGYMKLRSKSFEFKVEGWKWLALLIIGAVGGVLTKMSGVLPLIAFALDFAMIKELFSDKKRFIKFLELGMSLAVAVVAVLLLAKLVFPFFPIEKSIVYWKHFANSSSFLNRGWLQTFIQFSKAVMYLSPLLVVPLLFLDKEVFSKTRPFFLFILIGLIFYLFAFDFSIGALDRYFQFLVIPLCIISGIVFVKAFYDKTTKLEKEDLVLTPIITGLIFVIQFFNHFVPPLYPKTEWLSRLFSLKWNFLFPFTGGSGPTGFYISFLLIILVWICSLVFGLSYLKIKDIKKRALFCIFILGILYNGVFIEEYLFGKINGSPYKLFENAKSFIIKNNDIKSVLVYNDIGGFEIQQIGKYKRRIYATPQFEATYNEVFKNFSGYILFIDIPRIDPGSFYLRYMASCKEIFMEKDKYISSTILNCGNSI